MTQAREILTYEPLVERSRATQLGDRFLLFLAIVLAGYATFGRAFAYLGVPPIFIGEMTVVFGMITLLSTPRWSRMFRISPAVMLIPFMVWGLYRTVPYLSEYKFDCLRDAVLWAYSVFAFYVAGVLLAEPTRINTLLRWYEKYTGVYLMIMPFMWLTAHFAGAVIPDLPWATVPIITLKEGDLLVQLSGILAFWASGLAPPVRWPRVVTITCLAVASGVIDRGGFLAFLFVMGVCFMLRPRSVAPWRMVSVIGGALAILAITGISIHVPGGKDRDISFQQIFENVFSVTKSSKAADLDATKQWRLNWWDDIYHYTVKGPYFWGGKGYGVNLAEDDGYVVDEGNTLRSPHNVHMTFLARSGVMGVSLWALLNLVWAFGIAWGHLTARRNGRQRWASLFLFIGCFWAAFLINASFDVYLEGPMGGIWFWTVVGFGIASLWMYRKQPGALNY